MRRAIAQDVRSLARREVTAPKTAHPSRHASSPALSPVTGVLQPKHTEPRWPRPQDHGDQPLAMLPLASVMRTHFIMSLSSRPAILGASTAILQRCLAPTPSWLFDVERNRVLNWFLRKTFYAQFCSGRSYEENRACIEQMRRLGYSGVILEYAREVLDGLGKSSNNATDASRENASVEEWRDGLLETIRACDKGDFIAMKWSGMGKQAHHLLKTNQPPSPSMEAAIVAVCDAAADAGVDLMPAAEPQNAQAAVDAWTLQMAERYNKLRPGHAVLYNTYQAYLKSTPSTLARHLALANDKGFTLGVKLVRGAYLHSEQRNLIWDRKDETDTCYDGIARDLVHMRYGHHVKRLSGSGLEQFPAINIMIATHNDTSVQRVRRARDDQMAEGKPLVPLAYAQLYGMADEVSCTLLDRSGDHAQTSSGETPRVYKYATWGSMKDCLSYLLRRADENKDALSRTRDTRDAMRGELWRRLRTAVGI